MNFNYTCELCDKNFSACDAGNNPIFLESKLTYQKLLGEKVQLKSDKLEVYCESCFDKKYPTEPIVVGTFTVEESTKKKLIEMTSSEDSYATSFESTQELEVSEKPPERKKKEKRKKPVKKSRPLPKFKLPKDYRDENSFDD